MEKLSKLAAFQSYTSALSPSGYRRDWKSLYSFKEAHFTTGSTRKLPENLTLVLSVQICEINKSMSVIGKLKYLNAS